MSSVIIARFVSDIWRNSLELLTDCETTKWSEKINFFLLLSTSLVSVCDQTFPIKLQLMYFMLNDCSWKAEILAGCQDTLIQAARCTFKHFFFHEIILLLASGSPTSICFCVSPCSVSSFAGSSSTAHLDNKFQVKFRIFHFDTEQYLMSKLH